MRTKRFKTTIVKESLSNALLNSGLITTPCEKVLSILRQAKNIITNLSDDQTKIIQNLDWCIKVITSRSLYSYELKEKEAINKLSKGNPELKQLVDFVSEYNEKVIKMNRKYNILTDELLQKSSTKLNKRRIERKNSFTEKETHFSKVLHLTEQSNDEDEDEDEDPILKFSKNTTKNKDEFEKRNTMKPTFINTNFNTISNKNNSHKYIKINNKSINNINSNNNSNFNSPIEDRVIKKRICLKKNKKKYININDEQKLNKTNDSTEKNYPTLNKTPYANYKTTKCSTKVKKKFSNNNAKLLVSFDQNYMNKKNKNIFPSVQKISITINNDNRSIKNLKNSTKRKSPKNYNSINSVNISLTNSIVCPNNNNLSNYRRKSNKTIEEYEKIASKSKSKKNIPHIKECPYIKIQNKLMHEGYDISKLITEKNFDIFELKDLIGHNNVLPILGRAILENLGLLDERILNTYKLENFLISVSNTYIPEALYHNSIHGSDVTHSVYSFFTHSNIEKVAKTNVLDLLSIIIASLGHDIGHPGLTNTFHINDSTEMAINYNDISVLENFHASTLFKTLRKSENNIFEKLSVIDYKIIRKRIISEILATDMANHGKVVSLIKSKISLNENNEYKLNLLTGNEHSKNEEQQSLLDFILHLADLAHNTKLFRISLQWVELLSEEFWRQGDLEKQLNLPVSFLCDRDDINIPKSQIGFISGFIIPTFESLVSVFPTLRYTVENANNNLKEWKKLMDEGRKKGWTPPKKKVNQKDNINISKTIKNRNVVFGNFSFLNNNLKNNNKNEKNEKNEKKENKVNDSKKQIKKVPKIELQLIDNNNNNNNNNSNKSRNDNETNGNNLSFVHRKNKIHFLINRNDKNKNKSNNDILKDSKNFKKNLKLKLNRLKKKSKNNKKEQNVENNNYKKVSNYKINKILEV